MRDIRENGLGKIMITELKVWMDQIVPEPSIVLLFSDGTVNELHSRYRLLELLLMISPCFSKGMALGYYGRSRGNGAR
jgi:hypothetical protein